jgi:hypothetical protein
MRRLIYRPLVLLVTFLMGLCVTFLLTLAGGGMERLLDEPSDTIPELCRNNGRSVIFASCSQAASETDEYAVYSAVIYQRAAAGGLDAISPVVIQDQTATDYYLNAYLSEAIEELKQSPPLLEQETVESFRNGNRQAHPLKNLFELPFRTILISPGAVEVYFGNVGLRWQAFYRRYPGAQGLVTLSKAGFNRSMNQALVYRAFTCGDTCGYGSLVFLVKEGGVWKIKGTAGQWIS